MAIDVIKLQDVPIYEVPEHKYEYYLAIESDGIWRVGAGNTIRDAIDNFCEVRHKFQEKPSFVDG